MTAVESSKSVAGSGSPRLTSNPAAATLSSGGVPSDAIEVELFENQRFFPFKGWGVALLPTDRPKFSSRDGKIRKSKDSRLPPPKGYEWMGDWELVVDYHPGDLASEEVGVASPSSASASSPETNQDPAATEAISLINLTSPSQLEAHSPTRKGTTDPDGWQYAFDFHFPYHPRMGGHSWVRRRRWIRRVRCLDRTSGGVGQLVESGRFVLLDDEMGHSEESQAIPWGQPRSASLPLRQHPEDGSASISASTRSKTDVMIEEEYDNCSFRDSATIPSCGSRDGVNSPGAAGSSAPASGTGPVVIDTTPFLDPPGVKPTPKPAIEHSTLPPSLVLSGGSAGERRDSLEASSPGTPVKPKGAVKLASPKISKPDPVQKVLSRWKANRGARHGSVQLVLHEVRLAQPFKSAFIRVRYQNKMITIPRRLAENGRLNYDHEAPGEKGAADALTPAPAEVLLDIITDHEPVSFFVIDDSAGARVAGEAVLSLRCPPAGRGAVRSKAMADGRYSEHGERVELMLFPPLSGAKLGAEDLYMQDALGSLTISWNYEIRDESMFQLLGIALNDASSSGFKQSDTMTAAPGRAPSPPPPPPAMGTTAPATTEEDPKKYTLSDVMPPKEKAGRLCLRVLAGKGLIDHTDATGAAGIPYMRRRTIHPYIVLHYSARISPSPAMEVCTEANSRRIVKTNKTIGEANSASDCVWGETLVGDVLDVYSSVAPLRVEVWDHNTFESNKFLGMAHLDPTGSKDERIVSLKLRPREDEADTFVADATALGYITARLDWIPYNL